MSTRLRFILARPCLLASLLLSFIPQMAAQPTPVRMRETLTLQGHEYYIKSVAFSPDGSKLASSDQLAVILWDVASGKLLRTLKGRYEIGNPRAFFQVKPVAFSPDGHTLALGNFDSAIILWDVDNWKLMDIIRCELPINSLAFSPDGHTLVSSGSDVKTMYIERRKAYSLW